MKYQFSTTFGDYGAVLEKRKRTDPFFRGGLEIYPVEVEEMRRKGLIDVMWRDPLEIAFNLERREVA